jgi:tRNA A37 threonylcarbamoyladenosine dehydratase/nitroreductase
MTRAIRDTESWRPSIFSMTSQDQKSAFRELIEREPSIALVDTLHEQLRDCARTRVKNKQASEDTIRANVERVLDGADEASFGNWIYFPWRQQAVHLLPESLFRELRLDRNRHKLTASEQGILLEKTIGIVGLSVGSSALTTLALEGVGGHFRIADFDALDVSNLNRLRAGVLDIGINKAVLAARSILEIDPYLDVAVFPGGIGSGNLDEFLDRLDLLIEECDDLQMKVRLRERARAMRIPVLMETTDRGMLDIERFDIEPERALFHGRIGQVSSHQLEQSSNRDRVPFVLAILDERQISASLAASLVEMEKSVYTWPQLASAVSLGGALLCHAARHVLLGKHQLSGRFYVDLDRLVSAENVHEGPAGGAGADAVEVCSTRECPPPPRLGAGLVTDSEARFLVDHARYAPSGGNVQPWQFVFRAGVIECSEHPTRAASFLDLGGWGARIALGAAIENICIAAESIGCRAIVREMGTGSPLASIAFERVGAAAESSLRRAIFDRITNRRRLPQPPLSEARRRGLLAEAERLGLQLVLTEGGDQARELGAVLGAADRLRFTIRQYHAEMMSELRFSDAEAALDRTGIDVATLELSPADLAGVQLARRWDVMAFLAKEGLGEALEDGARRATTECAAVGLLAAPSDMSLIEAGRRLQRLWLYAASSDLAWQPWTAILPMYARAKIGAGLSDREQKAILSAGQRLMELWPLPENTQPLFVFRVLERAPAPSRASLRLSVDEVLRTLR